MVATLFGTFSFYYYFLSPNHSFVAKPEELPRFGAFVASSLFVFGLGLAQRGTTESLKRARDAEKETVKAIKKTNEALGRTEAYLAEAQRLSHTGSFAWKVATREVIHASEEWRRLYGFDVNGRIPTWEERVQRIHPEDQERYESIIRTAIREKTDYDAEFRITFADGSLKHVHAVGHPILNERGDLVEFIGTAVDVTERKQAEEERDKLRQAQADLAHISRVTTMGELTASLAHEVRQPIAAAVTNANTCLRWLERDQPDIAEARAAATRIVKDANRAAEIISHIRLLFQKGTPERALVDVNEVIEEMTVLLRNEAKRHDVSIRIELAPNLPRAMADRVQLQQVFMNLMLNGIDAMKGVNRSRQLTIKSQTQDDGHLLISVSDTGVGLPSGQADRIFSAFFTTKPHGIGMGLPISRSIIESHDGRLWATDNGGQGTTFHFTLRAERSVPSDSASREARP